MVAGVGASMIINQVPNTGAGGGTTYQDPQGDVRFTRLQLRALGTIPFIQNSFFLINVRAERTFRLTFATFNFPLDNQGHYFSVNSGSGNLSSGLITSTSKQPLLDRPYYLFNAFEQRNGGSVEVGGPITSDNRLGFRIFATGGSGNYTGNVGGRFFNSTDRNFSYGAGGQLLLNIVGNYNRFDTPFLYSPVPLTIAVFAGARYDQRPLERYTAWNAFAILRYDRFLIRAEHYGRYVLDFDSVQVAWNVQTSILLIPHVLMLAADVGGFFVPVGYDPQVLAMIGGFSSQLKQPMEEFQARAAIHWWAFRNIGRISLLYALTMNCQHVFGSGQCQPPTTNPTAALMTHEVRVEAQIRF